MHIYTYIDTAMCIRPPAPNGLGTRMVWYGVYQISIGPIGVELWQIHKLKGLCE